MSDAKHVSDEAELILEQDGAKVVLDHRFVSLLPTENIHLLTAEGNGRGGGDYNGPDLELVGTWARDVISVEGLVPEGYTELVCKFSTPYIRRLN